MLTPIRSYRRVRVRYLGHSSPVIAFERALSSRVLLYDVLWRWSNWRGQHAGGSEGPGRKTTSDGVPGVQKLHGDFGRQA